VICDYRLPDGNGLQLADRIREHCVLPPAFILVSGDTSPDILQAVNERGHHLLHKPVRPAKLRSLILFLLKKREGGG
jgi:CheY-like chemotaxis protein